MEQMSLFHIDSESAGRKPEWVKVRMPIGGVFVFRRQSAAGGAYPSGER